MTNVYLHFLSDIPVRFVLFNNSVELFSACTPQSLSKEIDLEITSPENFSVFVYPLNDKNKLPYRTDFYFENDEIKSKNRFIKIYKLPENHFFIVFLPFLVKNNEFLADKLEISNQEVKKLSLLNDMAGRGKVEIFKIENDKLAKTEEYFVSLGNDYFTENVADIILLSFFEAISTHDYSFARRMLSSTLSTKLNDDNLKTFFGDFSHCILLNYYSFPSVALFYEDGATNVFSANFQDGKIVDIYDIN